MMIHSGIVIYQFTHLLLFTLTLPAVAITIKQPTKAASGDKTFNPNIAS